MKSVLEIATSKQVRSEHVEQVHLIQRLKRLESKYPELELLYAVPNGGLRLPKTASMLKAEGVKAAVCDLVLPTPRWPFHGLYVEMKRVGEYARPDQREYQRRLIEQGYAAVTCQGDDAAFFVIETYLQLLDAWEYSTLEEAGRHSYQHSWSERAGVSIYPPDPAGVVPTP